MPRRDGTGPIGSGRSGGETAGRGRGAGRGFGPPEECICTKCGAKTPHTRAVPCLQQKCPKCGAVMTRA